MSRKQQIEDVVMALVVSSRGPITPFELGREYKTLEVTGLTFFSKVLATSVKFEPLIRCSSFKSPGRAWLWSGTAMVL